LSLIGKVGKVQTVRTAGSKLVFLDVKDGDSILQIVVQLKRVEASGGSLADLKSFTKVARKGDWISFTGHPHRTGRGQLSLLVTELPVLMSPSLHQIPEVLEDPETRARQRHVDMLVNPATVQTLRVRHIVERAMHSFFNDKEFIKVNTPILQSGAGGAVARAFETEASELQGETLNLRIAPELWLKRLMVGGMDRVYEFGPVFRNEGVDATHNPEFTICEFYAAKATLDDLMQWTEALFRHIQSEVSAAQAQLSALDIPDLALSSPFQVLEFIPDLEKAMNRNLPDLSSTTAHSDIMNLFAELNLDLPSKPTLPRLLDALAAAYLEPLCTSPTFITNHPACLSPLSKHFTCPQTSQRIAARAELFVAGRELANMYEEENSPFAQRAKFEQQLLFQAEDGEGDGRKSVDESYLAALEWGLPPTGGWGCGVDRLVMLFSGRPRLGDVLAFGGLRNVAGLGAGRK
jgi:lysyl-tRNA synthetase class 2